MGVLGARGRGIGEYFGVLAADVAVWMGILSSCGGYIAGSKALVRYLKYTALGFVFNVGLSPPNAAASLASVHLLMSDPARVVRLHERSRLFLELAKKGGLNTGMSEDSPVITVILGNFMHCLQLSKSRFKRGIDVQPILRSTIEENAARRRFFITSLHTEEQVRFTVKAIVEELKKIGLSSSVGTDDFSITPPLDAGRIARPRNSLVSLKTLC